MKFFSEEKLFCGNKYLSVSFFIVAKLLGVRIAHSVARLSKFTTGNICIVMDGFELHWQCEKIANRFCPYI